MDLERLNTSSGCAVTAAFVMTLAIFAIVGFYLTDYLGIAQGQHLVPVGLIAGGLMAVGFRRRNRVALTFAGWAMVVFGSVATAVSAFDFVRRLITGESFLARGQYSAYSYGVSMFLMVGIGLTIAVFGWFLTKQRR